MYVCVECGNAVSALHNSYGKGNIVLERCPKCNEIADKYTEFDGVIKSIDLILHKIPVYRHILINSSLEISFKQTALFLIYLAMIEVHLLQSERNDIYRSIGIFISSIGYNLIYSLIIWAIPKLNGFKPNYKRTSTALILGSFPQVLHLLFLIWDYPQNDQFNIIINLATFTSHLTALSAVFPSFKIPFVSIVFAHALAIQVKKLLLP